MVVNSLAILQKTATQHPNVLSVLVAIEVIFFVRTLLNVGIVREDIFRLTKSAPYSLNNMRVLQSNIQSINTSKGLMNAAISRNDVDVVALQEVWHPSGDMIFRGFSKPILKLRDSRVGGGVGIAVSNKAKMVSCKHYEVPGLEAVWAEVKVDHIKTLIGSV